MIDDYAGNCAIHVADAGQPTEHTVVVEADERVRISAELLREIVDGRARFVEFGEGVMRFGTEGRGLGVVAYEIDDPKFLAWLAGRVQMDWLTMQRLHEGLAHDAITRAKEAA